MPRGDRSEPRGGGGGWSIGLLLCLCVFGLLGCPKGGGADRPESEHRWRAVHDKICRTRCETEGRCLWGGKGCLATTAGCARSPGCAEEGLCAANETGQCIPDPACKRACAEAGQCLRTTQGCVAVTREHCAAADVCRINGRCSVQDGSCVALTREDCKHSTMCRQLGDCAVVEGACKVGTLGDCVPACADLGLCHVEDLHCTAWNADDCGNPCRRHGRCVVEPRTWRWRPAPESIALKLCVASETTDCTTTEGCVMEGRCTLEKMPSPLEGGTPRLACVVAGNADCGRSRLCTESGRCTAKGGLCVGD